MTERRRVIDYAATVLAIVFALVLLRARVSPPDARSGFDRAVIRLTAPLQAVANWTVSTIGDGLQQYLLVHDAESENRVLRRKLAELEAELARLSLRQIMLDDMMRAESVRGQLDVGHVILARVVSARLDTRGSFRRLSIEHGSGAVRPGHSVLAAGKDSQGKPVAALVGRVDTVAGSYADILLISDERFAVDARVARTGSRVLVRGHGPKKSVRVTWTADRSSEIVAGDVIETSGFGGVVPRGVFIGEVRKEEDAMTTDDPLLLAIDPSGVSTVIIVATPNIPKNVPRGLHPQ